MLYIYHHTYTKSKQIYHLHLQCKSTSYAPSLFLEYSSFCKNSFCHIPLTCVYACLCLHKATNIPCNSLPSQTYSLFLFSYTAFLLGYDNQRFLQFCSLCSHGHVAKSTFLICAFQWATFGIAGLVLPQLLSWKPNECQLLPQLSVFRRDREHLIKQLV